MTSAHAGQFKPGDNVQVRGKSRFASRQTLRYTSSSSYLSKPDAGLDATGLDLKAKDFFGFAFCQDNVNAADVPGNDVILCSGLWRSAISWRTLVIPTGIELELDSNGCACSSDLAAHAPGSSATDTPKHLLEFRQPRVPLPRVLPLLHDSITRAVCRS